MKHQLFSIALTFATIFAFGQNDNTFNKLNIKEKKDGVWIQFLDSLLYPTDSSQSYFYGYELYDNGKRVFSFSNRNKIWRKFKMVFEGHLPRKGKPELVEGTFKLYNKHSMLEEDEIYRNGKPYNWHAYHYSKFDSTNCIYEEVLYFDKLYNNIPGTHCYEELINGAVVRKSWFRKGKRRWNYFKFEENN